VLITQEPYAQALRLAEACERYQAKHGTAYHPDLVETERARCERYIGQTGSWHWLAAYAPLASNEILAAHTYQGDFAQLADHDIAGLASGLSATLKLYAALGYLSFNFTLYARRDTGRADGFQCLLRCMTRQNPYANYRADDFFLQKGLQTELILTLPEYLAQQAAKFFST
jgi:UDPglucose--hexose-1-phosphate uridylyltransferase